MASTNKTVNLTLSQYVDTDTPTWLGDYNADMLAIDNGVGAVQATAKDVESRILAVETDVTGVKSDVQTLKDTTAQTSTQVSELTSTVATNTASIATINTQAQGTTESVSKTYGGGTITLEMNRVPLVGITFVNVRVHDVTIANGTELELHTLPANERPSTYLTQFLDRDASTGVELHIEVNTDTGKVFLNATSGSTGTSGTYHNSTATVCVQHN